MSKIVTGSIQLQVEVEINSEGLFDQESELEDEEGIQREIDIAATQRLLYDGEGMELE